MRGEAGGVRPVAVWAHVGGFVTGLILGRVFEDPVLVAQRRAALRVRPGWAGAP